MVYCGKPSEGCETCRKARKRCGLEQPACSRCIRLKKECGGYPDRTQLRIRDQSKAVILKAAKNRTPRPPELSTGSVEASGPDIVDHALAGSTSPLDSEATVHPPEYSTDVEARVELAGPGNAFDSHLKSPAFEIDVPALLKQNPDDVAMSYFLKQFTLAESDQWSFLRHYAIKSNLYPCLDLAMRACGMAALANVEKVTMGRYYAQTMYTKALGLLNEALKDPNRSRADDSLIGVTVLGYYEMLTSAHIQSIQSWKAHIKGAAQLLKLRGRAQLQSPVGRHLFRETEPQIIINCIWDNEEPPDFLWDLEGQLEALSTETGMATPAENLTKICLSFAALRARIRLNTITDVAAAEEASHIESRLVFWATGALASDTGWRYSEMIVPDSSHVWNGKIHEYQFSHAFGAWTAFRNISIVLIQTQELLLGKMQVTAAERDVQTRSFEARRRQLVDDICAAVPCALRGADQTDESSCVLIRAYSVIWPLYLAGTCALERVRNEALEDSRRTSPSVHQTSAASAQAAWILGRLQHIATHVGLKWASVIATVLNDGSRLSYDQVLE